MADYPIKRARKKWARPYGGVVWIAPRHLEPNHKRDWGSHQNWEDRKGLLPAEWGA